MSAASIGERIRLARKAKGLSLADVGAVLGVSVPFLHDVEHDRRRVTRERAPAFAKALDLRITDLTTPDPAMLDLVIAELAELGGCERAVLRLRELRGVVGCPQSRISIHSEGGEAPRVFQRRARDAAERRAHDARRIVRAFGREDALRFPPRRVRCATCERHAREATS